MIFLLGFSFLAGLVTILAPCMWPMLPIVLSSTVKGTDHKRPLGITVGVMASFAIFTLSVSYLVRLFHFDPNILRIIAVFVIVFLGLTLIVPALTRILEGAVSSLTGKLGIQRQQGSDFKSGLFTGLTLGVIWSPCGGPILASIATLAATGMVTIQVILVTLAYVTGVGLPLFLFTYGGQRLVTKTRFVSAYTGRIQQIFGVIMILTAIAIYFNYDKVLQLKLLSSFPSIGLNGFENSSIVRQELDVLKGKKSLIPSGTSGLFNTNTPAPEFTGITKWLNTDHPLTMRELRGKVILIDFWTYTCINCIRTLPHVTGWYEKYKNEGFTVVGVHTPEFEFEKNTENVKQAISQYHINYPVAQDNNYATWMAYNNHYWPAKYLIDAKGIIRYTHFGEGNYEETEKAIQDLLAESGRGREKEQTLGLPDNTPKNSFTPETYLGSQRMEFYYPDGSLSPGEKNLITPANISDNSFSLGGQWIIENEYAAAQNKAVLILNFFSDKVFLVMRPPDNTLGKVKVFLDDKIVSETNMGDDVKEGVVEVDRDRLYNLINLHGKSGKHLLRLEFMTPGIMLYAFTFG